MKIIQRFILAEREIIHPERAADTNPIIEIKMPRGSEVIDAHFNHAGQLMLSAIINPEEKEKTRTFVALRPGDAMPDTMTLKDDPHPAITIFIDAPQASSANYPVYVFEIMPR